MPIPDTPFKVHGGCGCGSIRYTVNIPDKKDRPVQSAANEEKSWEEGRYPSLEADHCNDCRRVTGALINFWFIFPRDWATLTLKPSSSSDSEDVPATVLEDLSKGKEASSTLGIWKSSEHVYRGFCRNCGTNLTYMYAGPLSNGQRTLDIQLGSVDREDVEKFDLSVQRHSWWEAGYEWSREWFRKGDGKLPRHPTGDNNSRVEE